MWCVEYGPRVAPPNALAEGEWSMDREGPRLGSDNPRAPPTYSRPRMCISIQYSQLHMPPTSTCTCPPQAHAHAPHKHMHMHTCSQHSG